MVESSLNGKKHQRSDLLSFLDWSASTTIMKLSYWNLALLASLAAQQTFISAQSPMDNTHRDAGSSTNLKQGGDLGTVDSTTYGSLQSTIQYTPRHHSRYNSDRGLSTQQPESRELLQSGPESHPNSVHGASRQRRVLLQGSIHGPPHHKNHFTKSNSPPQPYRSLSADEPQDDSQSRMSELIRPFLFGTCYDPSHALNYPLRNSDASHVAEILDKDFAQLRTRFSIVRTYSAQYYGNDVTSVASKYKIKLYLGLHDYEDEKMNDLELKTAVTAAAANPDTVKAIFVGNEDLITTGGKKSVEAIISLVERVKQHLSEAGASHVQVGTAQQAGAFLNKYSTEEMARLVESCDIIGLNIYPFFSEGYDKTKPIDILDKQWNQVLSRFPSSDSKFVITETGFPSSGKAPDGLPENIPSPEQQKNYFQAVQTRSFESANTAPVFWFMAYDRQPHDPLVTEHGHDYEQYFGVFTAENEEKGVF